MKKFFLGLFLVCSLQLLAQDRLDLDYDQKITIFSEDLTFHEVFFDVLNGPTWVTVIVGDESWGVSFKVGEFDGYTHCSSHGVTRMGDVPPNFPFQVSGRGNCGEIILSTAEDVSIHFSHTKGNSVLFYHRASKYHK